MPRTPSLPQDEEPPYGSKNGEIPASPDLDYDGGQIDFTPIDKPDEISCAAALTVAMNLLEPIPHERIEDPGPELRTAPDRLYTWVEEHNS